LGRRAALRIHREHTFKKCLSLKVVGCKYAADDRNDSAHSAGDTMEPLNTTGVVEQKLLCALAVPVKEATR